MKYSFPDPDGPLAPEWKAPLERMMAITAGDRRYRWLDPDDLMVMVRLLRPPRPSIVVYKHSYSRRHLNLDDSAQAYRYIPPRRGSKSQGRHDRHRSLDDALKALALYELPWMKPGLELERRGLDWGPAVDAQVAARGRRARRVRRAGRSLRLLQRPSLGRR